MRPHYFKNYSYLDHNDENDDLYLDHDEEDLENCLDDDNSDDKDDCSDEKRQKFDAEAEELLRPDDPQIEQDLRHDPKDPLALNALLSPKDLDVTDAEQAFKVEIQAKITRINYTDGSEDQKIVCPATMTVKAYKGFHKDSTFYQMILTSAQSKLRHLYPYTSFKERGVNTTFEKPVITYHVLQGKSIEKVWVQFPLNESIFIATPPSIMQVPNHAPHARFYIDFDLAVNTTKPVYPKAVYTKAPEATSTPMDTATPTTTTTTGAAAATAAPVPIAATAAAAAPTTTTTAAAVVQLNPNWPEGTEKMVEQMTDLALKQCILSPMITFNKLSRIFHTFRRAIDPAFKRHDNNEVMSLKRSYQMIKSSAPPSVKKGPNPPERLWMRDSISEDNASFGGDDLRDFHSNKNVDARNILNWRTENRDQRQDRHLSGDRDPERGRGLNRQNGWQDRPFDRSNSRGPQQHPGNRSDNGPQHFQRGNRRGRGSFRK